MDGCPESGYYWKTVDDEEQMVLGEEQTQSQAQVVLGWTENANGLDDWVSGLPTQHGAVMVFVQES